MKSSPSRVVFVCSRIRTIGQPCRLTLLKVVAGDQANTSKTRPPATFFDFGLPPSVVLHSQYRKDVTFAETQFLGDCCRIAIQGSSYTKKLVHPHMGQVLPGGRAELTIV